MASTTATQKKRKSSFLGHAIFYFSLLFIAVALLGAEIFYELNSTELQEELLAKLKGGEAAVAVRDELNHMTIKFLAMLGVLLVVSWIMFALFTGRLRRSVELMTARTRLLFDGDYDANPIPRAGDELSELGRQIKQLSEKTQGLEKKLRRSEKRLAQAETKPAAKDNPP